MTAEQKIKPAPIRKQLRVRATPERAFDVFLGNMGGWWLPGHTLVAPPLEAIIVEPMVGGRWYERGANGDEAQWGRVLAWEPPARAVLNWQLSSEWRFDPDFHTEIEIRFTADGDHTIVDFEHRGLEAYGEMAGTMRDSMGEGWRQLLDSFAAKASG